MIGVNSRLDSIQAAVLRIKLRHLDSYCKARLEAASYYDEGFENITQISIPVREKNSSHVFHQYVMKLDKSIDRDALREFLTNKKIPSNVYYPVPLNKQKAYALSMNNRDFPVTYELCDTVIALPIHTEFDIEQQDYIIEAVIEFLTK